MLKSSDKKDETTDRARRRDSSKHLSALAYTGRGRDNAGKACIWGMMIEQVKLIENTNRGVIFELLLSDHHGRLVKKEADEA